MSQSDEGDQGEQVDEGDQVDKGDQGDQGDQVHQGDQSRDLYFFPKIGFFFKPDDRDLSFF